MVVQVATVFCSVRNGRVHLIQLLTRDGVGDQWRFVQRLVISRLGDDASSRHGFKGQLNAGFNHGNHQDAVVEEFLLGDFYIASWGFLEVGFSGIGAPLQQIFVVVGPVFHHGLGEVTADDVVLVLVVQRTHDLLQLFSQIKGFDLGRVGQTVQHVGHATVLQSFGDGFPAVLDQARGIASVDAFFNHLVEAQDRPGLQHAAQDGLLAHQVGFNFGDEGRHQNAGFVTARTHCVGFGQRQAFAFWIVVFVHGDQGRYTEATHVFSAYFRTWALGSNHDDGQVVTDFHAFFDNVETVRVRQASAVLHQRHNSSHNSAMLLVWCQVQNQVCGGDQFFVGTHGKAVFSRVLPGLALLGNGFRAQGVGNVQAAVAQVQTLVKALCTATDDDQLFAFQRVYAISKFSVVHEAAFCQLSELLAQR